MDTFQITGLPGLLLVLATGLAEPGDTGRSNSCVARDLAVVTLIEAKGESESSDPLVLSNAFVRVLDARKECEKGKADQALAIYDRIVIDVTRSAGATKDP